ncbi:MAG: ribonuclease III [Pseudomonadales bacterium]|nr:ribonuclease III [Pseudomonadales bacterium]
MPHSAHSGYAALQQRLGYQFNDLALLQLALRHKSAGKPNNERLEFLGDALLNAVVADALFAAYQSASEGELTTARSRLVKGKTLAQIGDKLGLVELLELGAGERKGFSRARKSILEDAVEAIIGAVYLDSDFYQCAETVRALLSDRLDDGALLEQRKDAKTALQEYTQANKLGLPLYTVQSAQGPEHRLHFTMSCSIKSINQTSQGQGSSRREAEQSAARKMLAIVENRADDKNAE